MRVFDCFPYWREAWAIELRLRLWEAVAPEVEYHPVAFYGDVTHRGDPLPEPAIDPRCQSVRVTLPGPDPWAREAQQRDAVTQLRGRLGEDDLILLTDADEIVDPAMVNMIADRCVGPYSYVKLGMTMYFFGARWRFQDPWRHPGAFFARNMPLVSPTLQVRMDIMHAAIGAAGWHFTYVGDIDTKLKAFAHAETDTVDYRAAMAQAKLTGRMGPYQLHDLPLQGVAGNLFREIVGD